MNKENIVSYLESIILKKFNDALCKIDTNFFEQITENDLDIDYYNSSDVIISDIKKLSLCRRLVS
ncbi:MAG: hypothetical protein Q4A09_01840 [Capnocytophaga felis]|nr:hypothetical protein [Capnocytophaga felis]